MDQAIRPYTHADYDFVWKLHIDNNQSYIDRHMSISIENIRQGHDTRINASDAFIIMNNKRIGCYFLLDKAEYYELGRFFIIPEMQGKKIGSKLAQVILANYATFEKPIIIHVWKDNPVQEFWYKMGFVFYKENDPFTDMIYRKEKS